MDICHQIVPLRKLFSVTLTYIFLVKITNTREAVPKDLPPLVRHLPSSYSSKSCHNNPPLTNIKSAEITRMRSNIAYLRFMAQANSVICCITQRVVHYNYQNQLTCTIISKNMIYIYIYIYRLIRLHIFDIIFVNMPIRNYRQYL